MNKWGINPFPIHQTTFYLAAFKNFQQVYIKLQITDDLVRF